MPDFPLLHVYGQGAWHDDVHLVGTADALRALQDAITRALVNGLDVSDVFCADGEGYDLRIIVATPEEMDDYALPYTDDVAREEGTDFWPRRTRE